MSEVTESTTSQTVQISREQQAVVDYRGGHLQVIACAGSGKTESVSRRIAALIQEGELPESIIAFTFTEKAAAELKERVTKRRRVLFHFGLPGRTRIGQLLFRRETTAAPRRGTFFRYISSPLGHLHP